MCVRVAIALLALAAAAAGGAAPARAQDLQLVWPHLVAKTGTATLDARFSGCGTPTACLSGAGRLTGPVTPARSPASTRLVARPLVVPATYRTRPDTRLVTVAASADCTATGALRDGAPGAAGPLKGAGAATVAVHLARLDGQILPLARITGGVDAVRPCTSAAGADLPPGEPLTVPGTALAAEEERPVLPLVLRFASTATFARTLVAPTRPGVQFTVGIDVAAEVGLGLQGCAGVATITGTRAPFAFRRVIGRGPWCLTLTARMERAIRRRAGGRCRLGRGGLTPMCRRAVRGIPVSAVVPA